MTEPARAVARYVPPEGVSLRDYMALQVRRLDDLRAADKEALRDTRVAMEKRLEGLNELRGDVAPKAALEALQRLVYIGVGLAVAASIAIPLLLRK